MAAVSEMTTCPTRRGRMEPTGCTQAMACLVRRESTARLAALAALLAVRTPLVVALAPLVAAHYLAGRVPVEAWVMGAPREERLVALLEGAAAGMASRRSHYRFHHVRDVIESGRFSAGK
jgi:hypothetical protein